MTTSRTTSVAAAVVSCRILDAHGHTVHGWTTLVDFRYTIPPASAFDDVWAEGVTQNHVRAPGCYRLVVTRDLPPGRYIVDVAVRDTRMNGARAFSST